MIPWRCLLLLSLLSSSSSTSASDDKIMLKRSLKDAKETETANPVVESIEQQISKLSGDHAMYWGKGATQQHVN